jgi:hypothetical protein
MAGSKRRNEDSIPLNYPDLLSADQLVALGRLESFGWSLLYVRRPKFTAVEVVLEHVDGEHHAILGANGEVEQETSVRIRGASEPAAPPGEPEPVFNDTTPIADQKEPIPIVSDKPPPKYLV